MLLRAAPAPPVEPPPAACADCIRDVSIALQPEADHSAAPCTGGDGDRSAVSPPSHGDLSAAGGFRIAVAQAGPGRGGLIPAEPADADPEWHARIARRDETVQLGDRIAELSSRIQAATYELLVLIRDFDAREGWDGCQSCAHWLGWRTGLRLGAAREKVRVAHALADLPQVSDAMRRGKISYSKVRAITRVATPATEASLLNIALSGTASHVERVVRGWRRADRLAEMAEDERRRENRALRTWVDEDGMVRIDGRLTPEVGAVVRRALEAACDRLSEDVREAESAGREEVTPAQRRADAIGLVAESALSAGLDPGTAGDRYQVVLHVDAGALADGGGEAPTATAGVTTGSHVSAGTSGSATGTPTNGSRVSVGTSWLQSPAVAKGSGASAAVSGSMTGETAGEPRVSAGTSAVVPTAIRAAADEHAAMGVSAGTSATAQAVLEEGGMWISTDAARRLACDAGKVVMRHDATGAILDVGRKTRTISPALRRALAARDRHCRFPGCEAARCDAHHVRHWADGGATRLTNLVLLCRFHHRVVHEEGVRVKLDADGAVHFVRANGQPLAEAPPAPRWTGAPLAPVDDRLAAAGIEIGPDTATPDWYGERLDLPWVIDLIWRPRDPEVLPA